MKNFFKKLKETFFKVESPLEKKPVAELKKVEEVKREDRKTSSDFNPEKKYNRGYKDRDRSNNSDYKPQRENRDRSDSRPQSAKPEQRYNKPDKHDRDQPRKDQAPKPHFNSKNSEDFKSSEKFKKNNSNQEKQIPKRTEAVVRDPAKTAHGLDKSNFRKRENVSEENQEHQAKLQDSADKLVKKHHGYKKKWRKPEQE